MHVICWLKVPPLRQPFKCECHESDYMCALYVANTRHALCIQSTTFMNTKRHRDICRQASPILERWQHNSSWHGIHAHPSRNLWAIHQDVLWACFRCWHRGQRQPSSNAGLVSSRGYAASRHAKTSLAFYTAHCCPCTAVTAYIQACIPRVCGRHIYLRGCCSHKLEA